MSDAAVAVEAEAVPTTPEQVLAAGGVSRRRRGTSASGKRRSPSGGGSSRRRPPTPEPHAVPPPEEDDEPASKSDRPSSPPPPAPRDEPPVPPVKARKKARSDKSASRRSQSASRDAEELIAAVEADIAAASQSGQEQVVSGKIAFVDGQVSTTTETIVTHTKRFTVEKVDPAVLQKEFAAAEEKTELRSSHDNNIIQTTAVVEAKPRSEEKTEKKDKVVKAKEATAPKEAVWGPFLRDVYREWGAFKRQYAGEYNRILSKRNQCVAELLLMVIFCGLGGLLFRFTEGAFESFYKCGVKRVKRNFIDDLWLSSHNLREEDWKSVARRRLMELENQLHAAHEAGVTSYSGQRAWSFVNAIVYCLTVVTTIGYGHISPKTTTGRAITIVYAIFGIPLFLILLADFGKLFTRAIKFLWAFVRRLYYTGSCKRVRRTAPVQEVWKGVQLVYDFATFRRPSQVPPGTDPTALEDAEASVPLNRPQSDAAPVAAPAPPGAPPGAMAPPGQTVLPIDGLEPGTPAPSAFEVDDEFNLPISIAIFILLAYIFVGAAIYFVWEDWGFFESFYFVFISMSTIGFGDFVPQHPMYMMASIVYLVFGLALTSMCINVVQIKLSDSFRQASAKLGATIGLRVTDEDGVATPIPATPVVDLSDVQPSLGKSAST
ncbi:uncharacterized protein LOC124606420 [Schistocerca americana]|uniref:uncharacterized protein LOC124606420 n=1 Tax=Schistocerca americana TaxID=7009 RepID=UPI001F4FB0D1|nr:uncharacterized protein LOC124606420 [Schistocerca americana]